MNMFDDRVSNSASETTKLLRKPPRLSVAIHSSNQVQSEASNSPYHSEPASRKHQIIKRLTALEETDDDYRHWDPGSQPYTTAEVLLQYLRYGWEWINRVRVKRHYCASGRCVELYSFEISKGNEQLCVPVISNPVILHLVQDHKLTVIMDEH
jgi:hypothetical protein